MTLEILQSEMIQAMKSGNKFRKSVITDLIASIKKAAIDKNCRDNITEELVNEVLLKCKKTAQEMIDTCPSDRAEKMAEYNEQLKIINEFAPQLITDPAIIENMILNCMKEAGLELAKANRGVVMKLVSVHLRGKVDMKIVSKVVVDILK